MGLFKKKQKGENNYDTENGYQNKGQRPNMDGQRVKRVLRSVKLVILLVVLAVAAMDSFYTLSENEMAVVTTFGVPSSVMTSGPKFKYPFIQKVHKMSKEIKGMPIGYDPDYSLGMENNAVSRTDWESAGENLASIPSESEMITKDFNFVNVDFYIEYQIVDPIKAYINNETAISILKNLAQSYIRDTVGSYSVDEVITTGKSEIQAKVKALLSERLESEDIGIGIYNVTIQDAEPPTEEVNNAFKAVEDAKQGMDTKINEAKKYQSEQLPAANAKADKAARDAEAYRQQRISEAEGQVSRFNDMYEEYAKYPLITKKRMFYETMEEILPQLKVIINGSDGTQTLLPLEPFSGTSSTGTGNAVNTPPVNSQTAQSAVSESEGGQ
ncbi:FtsH protease activity modulator HflK [Lacrimispora sp. 210928-DFI.3.58]|uniref:FtsH protease activity modulator HflK n=1 Tax=Lacrimispora sp. 210928-DFI.3.58 TaxID=2883214 RepID=UPI0015B6B43B|nr:FtsH protease activity modulator HflK [Lacrimispora sp. 210928-DFI.3.58]MCB7319287.1 FtsH protease activity modulator HflK [Lacrimispora sp. 210928-DFI.3.58]